MFGLAEHDDGDNDMTQRLDPAPAATHDNNDG
jgi:hypothetical protein